MLRIAAVLVIVSAFGLAQQAAAQSACRPTRDGKDRIAPAGGCPSGYYMRGACCESFNAMPAPGASIKTCPTGTISSLGACVVPK